MSRAETEAWNATRDADADGDFSAAINYLFEFRDRVLDLFSAGALPVVEASALYNGAGRIIDNLSISTGPSS